MAGWSKLKDSLEVKNHEIDREGHSMSCNNLDLIEKDSVFHDSRDTLESLFNQVIPLFLREISVDNCARPLPALLSNGQPVNLFQLFWVVKRKGGLRNVSENGMWGLVAEGCGFSPALMSSIESVYIKYLKEFDGWLRKVYMDARMEEKGEIPVFKKLGLLIEESGDLKGLVCSDEDKMKNTDEVEPEFDGIRRPNYGGKNESQLSVNSGDSNEVNHAVKSSNEYENDICIQHDKNITFSAKSFVNNIISSQKNKLCSEAKVDKVQYKVEASSRSYVDKRNVGLRDDYDILLSARSVVDKVISSMKSEFRPSGPSPLSSEVVNVGKTNDYDRSLSAKRIVDKGVESGNKVKNLWPWKATNTVHENVGNTKADCGKVHFPDNAGVGNPVVSRKRKLEDISLPGILKWISHVAKHSDDPAIGEVPGPSKWKSHGTKEYWAQALLVQEALLVRRSIQADLEESSLQKKQKMHPSMYEDINVNHKCTERVQRRKSFLLSKYQFSPHCSPAIPRKLASPCKAETHNASREPSSPLREGILSRWALDVLLEEAPVSYVSVGLSYQAEIPEWTSVASESDTKWLGIQMWVPEDEHNKTPIEKHLIGKGRPGACDCPVSGSACIGFHIAEKRLELKLALGALFYRWKFNRMGEEVSLAWTREEEKRFKAMVQLQDSTGHNHFWNNAFKLFPSETREDLVSYYFNVFVLRSRSYQNRVTPETIDSDDDETDFGPIGENAYYAGNLAPVYNLA